MLLVATALLLAPAPAQGAAPGRNCDLIEALVQPGTQALRGMRAEVNRQGLVDVIYRGRRTPIIGANQCELDGRPGSFEINCSWENESDLDAIAREHARLRAELAQCLPKDFVATRTPGRVEGLVVSEELEGEIERSDGSSVTVRLEIHTHSDDGAVTMYAVSLSIER